MQVQAKIYLNSGARVFRHAAFLSSTVRSSCSVPVDAVILDVSTAGVRICIDAELKVGDKITVGMSGVGMIPAEVMRGSDREFGCKFIQPISASAIDRALNADNVMRGSFSPLNAAISRPEVDRWPGMARTGIIVGSSLILWSSIFAGVKLAFG